MKKLSRIISLTLALAMVLGLSLIHILELGTGVHFRFGFDGDARISETLSTIPELNLTYGYAQKATATRLVLRCGWLQSCFYMDFILKRNKDGFSMICERPWMQDDGHKTVQRAAWVYEGAEV